MTIFAAASVASTAGGGGATGFYRSITVDHTKLGTTDLSDFPVLLDVTDVTLKSVSNGGHVNRTDGFDIIITTTSSGSTQIPYERELYDPATGHLIIWIKASSLSHTADTLFGYLRYGDSAITTDQSNAAGTWSNSFVRVYHMGNGSSLSGTDSTGTGNATATGATAATGQIYGGANFATTSNQYMDNGAPAVTAYPLTMGAWVKMADTSMSGGQDRVIVSVARFSGLHEWWFSYYHDGANIQLRALAQSDAGATYYHANATADTNWHRCVATFTNSNTYQVYQDGSALSGSTAGGTGITPLSLSDTYIGALLYNSGSFYGPMRGVIDEVHIASVARSADWILSEYNNQNSPSTFSTLGTETPL